MSSNQLANRVRRLRFDHGEMTQQQLAEKVGVTRQTIWNRIKRGDLEATYVAQGLNKGLFVKLSKGPSRQASLFPHDAFEE